MNSFLVLVLLAVLSTGYGLKCYKCRGEEAECTKEILEGNKTRYLVNCSTDEDTCQRVWYQMESDDHSHVSNSCETKQACEDSKKKCEDNEALDQNDKRFKKCAVACCSLDECNGSSKISFGVIFMAAWSTFGLALIK